MKNLIGIIVLNLALFCWCGPAFAVGQLKLNISGTIYVDEKKGGLMQPEGISCNYPSILLVADSGNARIVQFSFQDNSFIPVKELKLPQVTYPIRVQMNSKGEILSLDGSTRKIARISSAGEFNGYIEFKNVPRSANIVPRSFLVDDKDNIYVLDIYSGRVLSFGPSGSYVNGVNLSQKHGFISDLAIDSSGTIYVIDSVDGKIFFAKNNSTEFSLLLGNIKEYSDFPISIATDNKGHIFVLDKNGNRVIVLGKDGSFGGQQLGMGWKDGFLRYPSHICVNNKGNVFIADRSNNRVQIFSISE